MHVKDIMHTAVTTVTPETRVSTAYHVKVDLFLSQAPRMPQAAHRQGIHLEHEENLLALGAM
jgi:predicted transcriptional regulator